MEDVFQNGVTPKQAKHGKNMYVIEASVEYFISIVITGAYLAKIATTIGCRRH